MKFDITVRLSTTEYFTLRTMSGPAGTSPPLLGPIRISEALEMCNYTIMLHSVRLAAFFISECEED